MKSILIEVLGWTGGLCLLYAYYRISSGRWNGRSKPYLLFNIAGSFFFALNSGFHEAYPSAALNIIWAAIAIRLLASRGPSQASGTT